MTTLDFTRFKALTFDCYGTLIDWESGIAEALSKWTSGHGQELDRQRLLETFGRFEPLVERDHPGAPYSEILRRVHRKMAGALQLPTSADEQAAFGDSVPDWPAFPDSSAALKALSKRYRLVIVSNVDSVSFAGSQKRLGVEFDEVITAEQVGAYKPDHRMFRATFDAVSRWGVRKGEILHVAESLFHDHVPAIELGLSTVRIDRRGNDPGGGATPDVGFEVKPDLTVSSLLNLVKLVEESFGR